MSGTTMILQNS